MKRNAAVLFIASAVIYLVFSGSAGGPALSSAGNRTGAQGSANHCSAGPCHGAGTSTLVSITADSGSTPVSHYIAGSTYTIKIHGTNAMGQPKFGFQFAAVSGTGTSQVQAGSFPSPPTPLHTAPAGSGLTVIEHGLPIAATTPGTFDCSFQWTAPIAGAGDITLYCTLNAVNGNNSADGGDIAGNTSTVLHQLSGVGVSQSPDNPEVIVFPNPFANSIAIQVNNSNLLDYSWKVYDPSGKTVTKDKMELFKTNSTVYVSTADWAPGVYYLVVEKHGETLAVKTIKK